MGTFGTDTANVTINAVSHLFAGGHTRTIPRSPPSIQEQLNRVDVEAAREHLVPTQANVNSRRIVGLWGQGSVSYLKVFAPLSYFYADAQVDPRSNEIRIYDEVGGRLELHFRFRPKPFNYAETWGLSRCRAPKEQLCSRPTDPKNSVAQYSFTYIKTIDPDNSGNNVIVGEYKINVPGHWEGLAFPVMISPPRTGPGQYTIKSIVQEPPHFEHDTNLPGSTNALSGEVDRPAVAVYRTKFHRTYETRSPGDEQELSTPLIIPDALSQDALRAYGLYEFWFPSQDESVMVAEYLSGATVTLSGRLTISVDLKGFDLDPDEELSYGPCIGQFFYGVNTATSNILGTSNNEVVYRHDPIPIPHAVLWKRFGQRICSTP